MKEHNHLQRAMDELKTNWPLDHKLIEDEFARLNQINVELQERLDSLKQARPLPLEATDEMLRAMLAVRWPATYREHLRHPMNGLESQKQNEAEIKVAQLQYRAAVEAWK